MVNLYGCVTSAPLGQIQVIALPGARFTECVMLGGFGPAASPVDTAGAYADFDGSESCCNPDSTSQNSETLWSTRMRHLAAAGRKRTADEDEMLADSAEAPEPALRAEASGESDDEEGGEPLSGEGS